MDKMRIYFALSNAAIVFLSVVLIGGVASIIRDFSAKTIASKIGPRTAIFIDSRITFIGVIHHEISHMLLALITGAKVSAVKLFKVEQGRLGHVDIIPRGPFLLRTIQLALSGIAPVLCGTISLYCLYYFGLVSRDTHDIYTLIILILMSQISYHMSMSKQDVKIAVKGLWLIYIILAISMYIVQIDLVIYKQFLICIFAILAINVVIILIFSLVTSMFHH